MFCSCSLMSAAERGGGGADAGDDGDDGGAYRTVALARAWGKKKKKKDEVDEVDEFDEDDVDVDFGLAWRHLKDHPEAINAQDEDGRTILHCSCTLEDDAGRQVVINNLLAAGADTEIEDKYGWSPSESAFVVEANKRWLAWSRHFEHKKKDLRFLLEKGMRRKPTGRRIQQALWSCVSRYNVNARFDVQGKPRKQTPLHLVASCLGAAEEEKLSEPGGGACEERLAKWSSKRALLQLRREMEKREGEGSCERWTRTHDLLCLVLDLGADAELEDEGKRKASEYCASSAKSARALLESDWELGEKTRRGLTLTDNGDIVDATGLVVEENVLDDGGAGKGAGDLISDGLESISSRFATLSVDLIAKDVQEEGLYKRAERAERELGEWRRTNGARIGLGIREWPPEDARLNFEEWSRPGHPARRRRRRVLEEGVGVEEEREVEEVEREVEVEEEYEFV